MGVLVEYTYKIRRTHCSVFDYIIVAALPTHSVVLSTRQPTIVTVAVHINWSNRKGAWQAKDKDRDGKERQGKEGKRQTDRSSAVLMIP